MLLLLSLQLVFLISMRCAQGDQRVAEETDEANEIIRKKQIEDDRLSILDR